MTHEKMKWYAIRTIYDFGTKSDGTKVFEERIVCFEAISWQQAYEKASEESHIYATQGGYIAHDEQVGYEQDGAALIDGYEIWSELYEAKMTLEEFFSHRYGAFTYQPELPLEPH